MSKTFLKTLAVGLTVLYGQFSFAQEKATSAYVPEQAFSPLFYTQNGNEYRSASGAPGPKYWQNKVNYNISATLDEATNKVKASITITYKNNSPEKLPFLWLQLDQNSFKQDSRGLAITPARSRYGAQGEKFQGGYEITNLAVSQKARRYK